MTKQLNIGDCAPDFTLPADGNRTISLSDFAGKKCVVYFYPKDDTPGCTTQAIDFSAQIDAFAAANTEIIGISADNISKHDKFKAKHNLAITLLSDENQAVLKKYHVWVEKNMYGRKYMGIERTTFLLDEKQKIVQIWRKVRVKAHIEAVLQAVKKL